MQNLGSLLRVWFGTALATAAGGQALSIVLGKFADLSGSALLVVLFFVAGLWIAFSSLKALGMTDYVPPTKRRCPACREPMALEASRCPHCREASAPMAPPPPPPKAPFAWRALAMLGVFGIPFGLMLWLALNVR